MDNNFLNQLDVWASAISALFTMATAVIAFIALSQWRKQYEENKFLRLVDAIIEYNNCLIRAPKRMADDIDNLHRKALSVAGNEMHMRWLICQKTKRGKKNKELSKAMKNISIKHRAFLAGEITKLELAIAPIVTVAMHAG
ncbi:hypothetical protein ACDI96_24600 [Citrobacter telavivensis]